MAPSPRKSQRQRVPPLEREHRIGLPEAQKMIHTARRLIGERGIAAARTRDIAQACGLSPTAPLYYFGTKGRLLAEVLRVDHNQRLDALLAHVAPTSTHEQLLDALHATLAAFLAERRLRAAHELLAEITRRSLDDQQLSELRAQFRREYRDVLARILGDKQRDGTISLATRPAEAAAVLISLAQGLAVEISADPGWRAVEAIDAARIAIAAYVLAPDARRASPA